MKVNIKATRFELTDAIRSYIQEKADMLDRFLGDLPVINCDFEVARTTGHNKGDVFRAEINIQVPRGMFRVEKVASDMYKAIDKVKDHVEEMIIEARKKMKDKRK
jgi:putative sigma-54 modulation protein